VFAQNLASESRVHGSVTVRVREEFHRQGRQVRNDKNGENGEEVSILSRSSLCALGGLGGETLPARTGQGLADHE
jgi:hypothetical protein